jgi:hypothetical protein
MGAAAAAGDRLDRGGRGERNRLGDGGVRRAAAAAGVPRRADRLLGRRGASVVLLALLSPRHVSLSLDAATLLAVGLVLTGVGAYRLAATAGSGPLAAT